jgi:hypothetical protein
MFENGLGKNSEMKFLKILPIILLLQTGIILGEEGGNGSCSGESYHYKVYWN